MQSLIKGVKSSNRRIVKKQSKIILLSLLLATIGVIGAVYFYQYTHSAKLEQELNNKNRTLNEKSEELNKKSEQLNLTDSQKLELQKQVDDLNRQKQELETKLQAKADEKARIASLNNATASAMQKPINNSSSVQKPVTTAVNGNKQDWLIASGIPESDWTYVDYIVSKESTWNPNAVNKSSGACGLAQALPCSKLGPNWNDPVVALKWQYNYVKARYGSYAGAYSFWLSNHWY